MKFSLLGPIMLIAAVVTLTGCETKTADKTDAKEMAPGTHVHADGSVHSDDHSHGKGHSHGVGPHDGTMAEWDGGKYHVEFTVDHDKQQATVYVLGSDEKTAAPLDAKEITLTIKDPSFTTSLAASPQDGDPEGKASRFVGTHESLGVVMEYEGSISSVVDDATLSGNFKEEPHDHE